MNLISVEVWWEGEEGTDRAVGRVVPGLFLTKSIIFIDFSSEDGYVEWSARSTERRLGKWLAPTEGVGSGIRMPELLIMEIGDPFVPIKHDGVIYIRPPVG